MIHLSKLLGVRDSETQLRNAKHAKLPWCRSTSTWLRCRSVTCVSHPSAGMNIDSGVDTLCMKDLLQTLISRGCCSGISSSIRLGLRGTLAHILWLPIMSCPRALNIESMRRYTAHLYGDTSRFLLHLGAVYNHGRFTLDRDAACYSAVCVYRILDFCVRMLTSVKGCLERPSRWWVRLWSPFIDAE